MMQLSEAAAVLGGRVSGADTRFSGVSTDTRTLRADELFVALRGGKDCLNIHIGGKRGRQAGCLQRAADLLRNGRRRFSDLFSDQGDGHHPDCHRLAVKISTVLCRGFQCMAQCMAKIQDFAEPALTFIARHHERLAAQRA